MNSNQKRLRLKLEPILMTCLFIGPVSAFADTITGFNPTDNDGLVGSTVVSGGSTITLNTVGDDVRQSFETGLNGTATTTFTDLQALGKLSGDYSILDAERLNLGTQTNAVSIPDPITGGFVTVQTYDSNNISLLAGVGYDQTVSDIINVGDKQYINTQIARIESTGGILNVALGDAAAGSTADTNSLNLAAKQSTLFVVDGSGGASSTLNWTNNNRVVFSGVTPTTTTTQNYTVNNIVEYLGPISVTTVDGQVNNFNVTDAASLRNYNDWLITQLKSGNLAGKDYTANFNQAFSITSGTFQYDISAVQPDDVFEGIGERTVIRATGANASVNIAAGKTLEAVNAGSGAVRVEDGATATVEAGATLASQNGAAMYLTGANSNGTNDGVINGNFVTNNNNPAVGNQGGIGVNVNDGATFANNGILNMASNSGTGIASGIYLNGSGAATSATNSGYINVGINASSASGATTGVNVDGANASFTNNSGGEIYIGRKPQLNASDTPADIALNQKQVASGIQVGPGGVADNQGLITIGTLTQNAAAMYATGGDDTSMRNSQSGIITIKGNASAVPNENVGMLVKDAGANGNIINQGTINLNGVNASGIKVVSTGALASKAISTSSGTINIDGDADPQSGTRNYGVWVEGQGAGQATADIDSKINLSGNGAIGVHARGNAVVNVAQNSIPEFLSGTRQIGFFAYGDQAKINVLGTTSLSVATESSNLFRLENGADFSGANISMYINGLKSLGVMGTGAGTEVLSNGGVFEVNGQGAIGFQIEGGASGVIDNLTTLHLNGAESTAAIVDGQKHDLNGKNVGSPVASTILNSAATLSDGANGLTGYIARNQATLNNSGNITFTGSGGIGIRVESGATANNNGTITVNNTGIGMIANSGNSNLTTTANTSKDITVNGGNTDSRTIGLIANGNKSVGNLLTTANIILNGQGTIGAVAQSGGTINVSDSSKVNFNNTDQVGFFAVGSGSTLNVSTLAADVTTDRSTLYRIDDGAALKLATNTAITASGKQSTAIVSSGAGTQATTGNAKITLTGESALGLNVNGGASATISRGGELNIAAANGVGGSVDGIRTTLSGSEVGQPQKTTLTNIGTVSGSASGITGFIAKRSGTLVNQGTINLTGNNNTGILLQGANASNTGSITVNHGTGIRVDGAAQSTLHAGTVTVNDGTAGIQTQNGATLILEGNDNQIVTNGTAHGILLDTGTQGLAVQKGQLNVLGSGNGIENKAEISNVFLNGTEINVKDGAGIRTATAFPNATNAAINVSGSGTGYAFRNADGSATSNDLILRGQYQINGNGTGSKGIEALTTGQVFLQSQVNINHAEGGSALIAGTAKSTLNGGLLQSISTVSPVVDLSNGSGTTFENQGDILASSSKATAVKGSTGNDRVFLTKGSVVGDVATGEGSDQFVFNGGTLDGSLTMGNGNNNSALVDSVDVATTTHLTAGTGTGNTLTLNKIQSKGGSLQSDDLARGLNLGTGWSTINFTGGSQFSLIDNLKLSHSDVNIDASSTLFTGNGVNPVIAGGTSKSVTVTNAGMIDMTSTDKTVGNRLTIDGNNVGSRGLMLLSTQVNEGGKAANQFTDRLLVNGDASGNTLLVVKIAPGSNGRLTDLDNTGAVESDEGISLVQVAGKSSATAYTLNRGYVAVGPWQYGLYSFAPGQSKADQREVAGSGDQFWDYRLANTFYCGEGTGVVCASRETRPGVTPSIPSYLSVQLGSANYNEQIIDDLHKRLGEIRHQQKLNSEEETNVFARYIGANLKYDTNVGFKNYGYDFDLDISAVQLGFNILRMENEQDNILGGLAYTRGNSRIKPKAVDGDSSTDFDNDTLALYMTWQKTNGFYTDGVLFGGISKGHTDVYATGDSTRLKGHNWGVSIETGYPFVLDHGFEIEPQAQLMYQRLHFNNALDNDGNNIEFKDYDQTTARLGARLTHSSVTESGYKNTPYIRANYIVGWGNEPEINVTATDYNVSHGFTGGKYGQAVELGVGGTSSMTNDISLYGEVNYRENLNSYGTHGLRYTAGVRWTF